MEPYTNKGKSIIDLYILTALCLLIFGLLWGITGSLQYIFPGLMRDRFSFQKVRPLHVSSVFFWIILAGLGSMLTYLQQHTKRVIYSYRLLLLQYCIFLLTVVSIIISYFLGRFGGREYWEHPPYLALPIFFGWIFLLFNFVKSFGGFKNQPVYVWMWLTGIVFFLFTYLESYLWLLPYFRNNIINDMTVQWKSYGSMVGSWNMLIYGSSIFLMDKITNNKDISYSKIAFVLYFTGLFNLMFNWGHHIYTLPTAPYIKHISYTVSMTELFLIGRIIFNWRNTVSTAKRNFNILSFRFLAAADFWVFLTLLLAVLMSIPGINLYTHGTHITVAHTMGATIGINTFLLLAIVIDMFNDSCIRVEKYKAIIIRGYWIVNISLLVFWLSLIGAGIEKSMWQMSKLQISYSIMMQNLSPYFIAFFISGFFLAIGLFMVVYPLIRIKFVCKLKQTKSSYYVFQSN